MNVQFPVPLCTVIYICINEHSYIIHFVQSILVTRAIDLPDRGYSNEIYREGKINFHVKPGLSMYVYGRRKSKCVERKVNGLSANIFKNLSQTWKGNW